MRTTQKKNGNKFLEGCHKKSLQLAETAGFNSIAFPAISCGIFQFPLKEAAAIAVNEVIKFAATKPKKLKRVVFAFTNASFFEEWKKAAIKLKLVQRQPKVTTQSNKTPTSKRASKNKSNEIPIEYQLVTGSNFAKSESKKVPCKSAGIILYRYSTTNKCVEVLVAKDQYDEPKIISGDAEYGKDHSDTALRNLDQQTARLKEDVVTDPAFKLYLDNTNDNQMLQVLVSIDGSHAEYFVLVRFYSMFLGCNILDLTGLF